MESFSFAASPEAARSTAGQAQRREVQKAAHARCDVDPTQLRLAEACPGEGGVGCTAGCRAGCPAELQGESCMAPAKAGPAEQLVVQPAVRQLVVCAKACLFGLPRSSGRLHS